MSFHQSSTSFVQQAQSESDNVQTDLDPYNLTRYESTTHNVLYPQTITTQNQRLTESWEGPRIESARLSTGTTVSDCTEQSLAVSQQKLPAFHTDFDLSNRIITSTAPLDLNVTTPISIQQHTGIHLNRQEDQTWRGTVKLAEYPINVDNSPEVVHKKLNETVNYVQPITIKYLRPPVQATTGEIEIRQEPDYRLAKAPPIIIRQRPAEPIEPAPLVLREQPPALLRQIDRKCVVVSGRQMPPPPRRLIIERMAQMPQKPQKIVIERWLPYERQTRNVKFIKAEKVSNWASERNLIINWCAPHLTVTKEVHSLGTVQANPAEYLRMYGNSLLTSNQLNQAIRQHGIDLPSQNLGQQERLLPTLQGDLEALKLIDLDRWGLTEYKSMLMAEPSVWTDSSESSVIYDSVFAEGRVDIDGFMTCEEAGRLITLIGQRLNRMVDEARADKFVADVTNKDGIVDFETFKKLVVQLWI